MTVLFKQTCLMLIKENAANIYIYIYIYIYIASSKFTFLGKRMCGRKGSNESTIDRDPT